MKQREARENYQNFIVETAKREFVVIPGYGYIYTVFCRI